MWVGSVLDFFILRQPPWWRGYWAVLSFCYNFKIREKPARKGVGGVFRGGVCVWEFGEVVFAGGTSLSLAPVYQRTLCEQETFSGEKKKRERWRRKNGRAIERYRRVTREKRAKRQRSAETEKESRGGSGSFTGGPARLASGGVGHKIPSAPSTCKKKG